MARVNTPSSQLFYAAAGRFVDRALRADDSLFAPGRPIWSLATIDKLHPVLVERPGAPGSSFEAWLRDQLAEADPETILLAAELLYVHLLPAVGIRPEVKRGQIRRVLGWAREPIAAGIPPELDKALDAGVARAEQAFLAGRPFQLAFLLDAVRRWKQLPEDERARALADPWEFKRALFEMPIHFAYSQRELLLHIVHPDTFEAIMAREHKQQIAASFAHLVGAAGADVDRQLAQIRLGLEPQYGQGFSFYDERLRALWQEAPDDEGDGAGESGEMRIGAQASAAPPRSTDLDALRAWQERFHSENPISRRVAAEYPQWLLDTFGDRVVIRAWEERSLYVYVDGKLYQELWLNRVRSVYVLLYDGAPWNIAALPTSLARPRSVKRREPHGTRFFVTNDSDYQVLKQLMLAVVGRPASSPLPRTLGDRLRPYVELVSHLDGPAYTAAQIVDRLGTIQPAIVELTRAPDAEALAADLMRLRLLERLGDGRYRRWEHLSDATVAHMLRYAALTLLVPDGDGYLLPALDAPFDGVARPAAAWPLGGALLPWYEEAGLVRRNDDGTWQSLPGALDPLDALTPTARALNAFLEHLRRARASQRGLPPLEDAPLRPLSPAVLEERIAEIQRELLIDRDTILRIYRSLIAGQHVILSGPPGTGKTHLARILPRILWREEEDTVVLRMPATPELPPTAGPDEELLRREGYAVEVVTATEDWGVRHVIGGIAPQLQQDERGRALIYRIRHGHLTRAVLANYRGYDGETVPALDRLQRHEPVDEQGRSYRGIWLVIDEFTRAQIDAAFGSLLTTLGGQRAPTLAVPTEDGGECHVPLPRDFRLIGTLNSFDRHFLNQMSEAMKRRFAFIDILPPARSQAEQEQALAIFRALLRIGESRIAGVAADEAAGVAAVEGVLEVRREESPGEPQAHVRYRLDVHDDEARAALACFWRLFSAIRLYRQLGTAQAEAVYAALLTGRAIGMSWSSALDSALADTLADQLQVLTRDEQHVLLAAIEHAADPHALRERVVAILKRLPGPRQTAHLSQLKAHETADAPGIDVMNPDSLDVEQVRHLFGEDTGGPAILPSNGLFAGRLRAFASERGL